jgi:hypothetical protein
LAEGVSGIPIAKLPRWRSKSSGCATLPQR